MALRPLRRFFRGELASAVHVAFAADDRATVHAFHEAAIEAGGHDDGRPGLGSSNIRPTLGHSSSIRTATTSEWSAMVR